METSSPSGIRGRLTWSATADGSVGPTYITFTGLTERELPISTCASGVLVIPISGLCIGGGSLNVDCKTEGFAVFTRKGKDIETINFSHYRENVFRPYVKSKRGKPSDIPLSEANRIVQWQDGGSSQLKAITKEESMIKDEEMIMTANKHSASRSGAEQYLDLMSIFKLLKV